MFIAPQAQGSNTPDSWIKNFLRWGVSPPYNPWSMNTVPRPPIYEQQQAPEQLGLNSVQTRVDPMPIGSAELMRLPSNAQPRLDMPAAPPIQQAPQQPVDIMAEIQKILQMRPAAPNTPQAQAQNPMVGKLSDLFGFLAQGAGNQQRLLANRSMLNQQNTAEAQRQAERRQWETEREERMAEFETRRMLAMERLKQLLEQSRGLSPFERAQMERWDADRAVREGEGMQDVLTKDKALEQEKEKEKYNRETAKEQWEAKKPLIEAEVGKTKAETKRLESRSGAEMTADQIHQAIARYTKLKESWSATPEIRQVLDEKIKELNAQLAELGSAPKAPATGQTTTGVKWNLVE